MSSYKIFTDSSGDLSDNLLKKYDISVIPYYVTLNGKDYLKEGVEISQDEIFDAQVSGIFTKTSLPAIDDYITAFRPYLEEGKDIICYCLSQKLSGSVQRGTNAANMLKEEFPDRNIYVVDSKQATSGQALVIAEGARMLENGIDIQKVSEMTDTLAANSTIKFIVDDLIHLQKGGRLGKAAALIGTILNIKPVLSLTDAEVMPVMKVRGRKKALDAVCKEMEKFLNGEPEKYWLLTTSCNGEEGWKEMHDIFVKNTGIEPNFESIRVGATIGTHTGPTAIGVAAIKKYEYLI